MRKEWFRILGLAAGFCLAASISASGADGSSPSEAGSPAAAPGANPASDETLRAYLQIQEQIHEAMLAIEQSRRQSDDAVARNSKALADRLEQLEQSLHAQRATEQEAVLRANRTMMVVVSSFAALGCLAVLLTAYFQWRAVNRFTALSTLPGLASLRQFPALESGDNALAAVNPVEETNARLLVVLERLEKRIQDLERTAQPSLNDSHPLNNILDLQSADAGSSSAPAEPDHSLKTSDVALLVNKGQSLLNISKLEESVACFDEALAAEPRNTEALVKKGTALERMRRTQEALECYDQAIAIDSSMTIAYLYKGGLYNRLERFSEALACYEQALHTQEKRRAS